MISGEKWRGLEIEFGHVANDLMNHAYIKKKNPIKSLEEEAQ